MSSFAQNSGTGAFALCSCTNGLVKLTSPGVNFINVFTCCVYAQRSQKRKKLLELTVFFALLGSARVNAARKMLVKLTQAGPFVTCLSQTCFCKYGVPSKRKCRKVKAFFSP